MILESHLAHAAPRTARADGHPVVVHPDLEIPGRPKPVRVATPTAPSHPVPLLAVHPPPWGG
ncbi:hypothetical protein ACFV4M_18795 [Kitasatospora indigofera]|uniref:hypothetical protein n=1 Tax=Kitasatospora indigofera TaxID=67307 RepID=UPI003654D552